MNPGNLRAEDIARNLLRIAFIVLGVYLVVKGILIMVDFVARAPWEQTSFSGNPEWVGTLVYFLALFVVGGLLAGCSHRLTRWLYRSETPERLISEPEQTAVPVCPQCGEPYAESDYDSAASQWLCARCGTRLGP